ncbi:myb/SANT-like DNA-binding domain-containing protein 4 [Homarus americanus]|uniref:myb/SANT-like DNA-binding domain-containing protein 4 n=1 Tax=Homarus americanus TaxID=6706 RepID=UPI001C485C91|nr:myb/SANT-like DNA-binding domain-containing protein 4 [Homarus americanus]
MLGFYFGGKRRPNFSEAEVYALVTEVAKRKEMILGKLDSSSCTLQLKNHAWGEVLNAVNAVGRVTRNVTEIRRKFSFVLALRKKQHKIRNMLVEQVAAPKLKLHTLQLKMQFFNY